MGKIGKIGGLAKLENSILPRHPEIVKQNLEKSQFETNGKNT